MTPIFQAAVARLGAIAPRITSGATRFRDSVQFLQSNIPDLEGASGPASGTPGYAPGASPRDMVNAAYPAQARLEDSFRQLQPPGSPQPARSPSADAFAAPYFGIGASGAYGPTAALTAAPQPRAPEDTPRATAAPTVPTALPQRPTAPTLPAPDLSTVAGYNPAIGNLADPEQAAAIAGVPLSRLQARTVRDADGRMLNDFFVTPAWRGFGSLSG